MSLFDQMNKKDFGGDSAVGEKHLPFIEVQKLEEGKYLVKVDSGGGKHPNEIDHWFQWTELRVNDLFIGRVEFSAKIMEPIASFTLNLDPSKKSVISAITRCNKHGLWESTLTL